MSARRVTAIAAVVATVAIAAAAAVAYFSAAKTSPQPVSVAPYSSLPAQSVLVPTWNRDDTTLNGGGCKNGNFSPPVDECQIYPPAFTDALYHKTSNTQAAFDPATRYLDVDFAGFAPPGLTPDKVTAEVDFADDNGDAKSECMYFDIRRASSPSTVLGTFGSAASPLGCQPLVTSLTVSQSLDAVTNTDVANDLRMRIYFNNEGGGAERLYRAVIKVAVLGRTWTLLPTQTNDALDATPTGWVPWSLALVEHGAATTYYTPPQNWPANYTAGKYVSMKFPDTIPNGAKITKAELVTDWKGATTAPQCASFDVYSGSSKLATHGTTAAGACTATSCTSGTPPAMCTEGTTAWQQEVVALPEIDTSAHADAVSVRLNGWGGNKTDFDRVALRLNWSLGTFNCVDPHTETVPVTADTWADQNAPTSTGGSKDVDLKVKTQDGSRNRRAYVLFPLPSIGNACALQGATLKLNQTAFQNNGGTRTIDVFRAAAAWTEGGLSWNTAPATTGTPVGAQNPTAAQVQTWDVTSLVKAMYNARQNFGFVLRDHAEDAATASEQKYDSREDAKGAPGQLTLTFGEPG